MNEQIKELEDKLQTLVDRLDRVCQKRDSFDIDESDEIDLVEILGVLWRGKWLIVLFLCLSAAVGFGVAVNTPNQYTADTLIAPAEENSGGGLAGMAGQLGGLASLAGVNLSGTGTDKTALAIEVLTSRQFITDFIGRREILVPLMAAKGVDPDSGELIIDSEIYDIRSLEWGTASSVFSSPPSSQKAYREFMRRLAVSRDKKNDFITISFEFYSPIIARQWVQWIVEDINEEIKVRDVVSAKKSLSYLEAQLNNTSIAEMKMVFYELIEEQSKTIMFAEIRDEYVFRTIDEPVVPELKSGPNRMLIMAISILLGGISGVGVLLVRWYGWS